MDEVPLCGTKVVVRKDSGTCPSDHSMTSESARSHCIASIAVSHPVVVVVVVSAVAAAVWREEEDDVKNAASDSTDVLSILFERPWLMCQTTNNNNINK